MFAGSEFPPANTAVCPNDKKTSCADVELRRSHASEARPPSVAASLEKAERPVGHAKSWTFKPEPELFLLLPTVSTGFLIAATMPSCPLFLVFLVRLILILQSVS